jgi:hypothetical protein
VDVEEFWAMVEDARRGVSDLAARADETIAAQLVARLAAGGPETVLAFHEQFSKAYGSLYRWDVWAAAYLIGRGCSDDSFSDFCAGVIGLGRTWYERVLGHPDALAEHPLVRRAAAERDTDVVFSELINFATSSAYERITGDADAFYDALETVRRGANDDDVGPSDMGEDFDFDDDDEMRRRLPGLAELLLDRPADNS